jgi:protein-L-isoaspartate O-methyltransferase
MTEAELAIVRRGYAKQVTMPYNATHPRVEAAFAVVRREAFLGPGPWPILHSRRYVTTPHSRIWHETMVRNQCPHCNKRPQGDVK